MSPGTHHRLGRGHVREFITWILDAYWTGKTHTCTGKLGYKGTQWPPEWYRGFSVRPMGSYPCDTKVGDINEFDFLCVMDAEMGGRTLHDMAWEVGELIEFDRFGWNVYTHCTKWLEFLNISNTGKYNPHVSQIAKHGPATCIELSWTCTKGHSHLVSTDMSLAVQRTDPGRGKDATSRDGKLNSRLQDLPAPFQDVVAKEPVMVLYNPAETWLDSSCIYDIPIFDSISSHLTPNIKTLFRFLKLITKYILQHEVEADEYSVTGWQIGDVISSHNLKCWLFDEVKGHPHPGEWEGDEVVERVAGVLGAMGRSERGVGWRECNDIITGRCNLVQCILQCLSTNPSLSVHH